MSVSYDYLDTTTYTFQERAVQFPIINRELIMIIRMKRCTNMPIDHRFDMRMITRLTCKYCNFRHRNSVGRLVAAPELSDNPGGAG